MGNLATHASRRVSDRTFSPKANGKRAKRSPTLIARTNTEGLRKSVNMRVDYWPSHVHKNITRSRVRQTIPGPHGTR